MQSGTHDHLTVGETGPDLRLPGILLRSFDELTNPAGFGLSSDNEKHKSERRRDTKTALGKPDLGFCQVFPRSSKIRGILCEYRSLGILSKYVPNP